MYQSNKFPVSTILIQTIKIKSSSSIQSIQLKVLVAVWTMKYKKISSTFSLKHFFTSRVIDWIFFICRLYVSKQLTKRNTKCLLLFVKMRCFCTTLDACSKKIIRIWNFEKKLLLFEQLSFIFRCDETKHAELAPSAKPRCIPFFLKVSLISYLFVYVNNTIKICLHSERLILHGTSAPRTTLYQSIKLKRFLVSWNFSFTRIKVFSFFKNGNMKRN